MRIHKKRRENKKPIAACFGYVAHIRKNRFGISRAQEYRTHAIRVPCLDLICGISCKRLYGYSIIGMQTK